MQQDYSFAFRKLYSNFDKIKDKDFIKELCNKYSLDSWQFESLRTEVESKISKTNALKLNNIKQQEECLEELELLKEKAGKKVKRKKFKLQDKLNRLKQFSDIVFGSKVLLRKLSFLCNDKLNEDEIKKIKAEYQNKRILPITIGGETYHKGNRKFDFELENNKIIFKPVYKTKIHVEFICSSKQHTILLQLQNLIDQNNILPVTIRLSTEYIWLMFDEEILNGYGLKEKELKQELKLVAKECKEMRKEIAKKYYREQESRKLVGKIGNRYLAIDLNPEYIGWSVCDKIDEGMKVIEKCCYDLKELSKKLNVESAHLDQIYQNNKRKHEICCLIKDLFTKATYYRVAYFCIEDLNFKSPVVNEFSKQFNSKVKNIWHRNLTCNLIKKYCNCLGIQKIEVNPTYTSFIGNIQYEYFDPINASLEICRRSMYKFEKGAFLPKVTKEDLDTMSRLISDDQLRDVQDKIELLRKLKSLSSWRDFFNLFKQMGVKYRRSLNDFKKSFERYSLFSLKSKVLFYIF
jgi:IS605 OrfB family transposase